MEPVEPLSAPDFDETLRARGIGELHRGVVRTLQVNLGKRCNMACRHCHVEAGPNRAEVMPRRVAERVIELLEASPQIDTLDLTGGAPELNPSFRWIVAEARRLSVRVIDRCNLTVLFEPGMEDLPQFLAAQQVEIVASLPCYLPDNVETQRGKGTFGRSIEALQTLCAQGYGAAGSGLSLNLVYNPIGANLPPPQRELEARYRHELGERFGISFNHLLTITNMPIARFAQSLARAGRAAAYMALLVEHFNPRTVPELMCRSLVSVSFDGRIFDCDFNQMLELGAGTAPTIWDLSSLTMLDGRRIGTAAHCFGCTAGAGSSCSGALK